MKSSALLIALSGVFILNSAICFSTADAAFECEVLFADVSKTILIKDSIEVSDADHVIALQSWHSSISMMERWPHRENGPLQDPAQQTALANIQQIVQTANLMVSPLESDLVTRLRTELRVRLKSFAEEHLGTVHRKATSHDFHRLLGGIDELNLKNVALETIRKLKSPETPGTWSGIVNRLDYLIRNAKQESGDRKNLTLFRMVKREAVLAEVSATDIARLQFSIADRMGSLHSAESRLAVADLLLEKWNSNPPTDPMIDSRIYAVRQLANYSSTEATVRFVEQLLRNSRELEPQQFARTVTASLEILNRVPPPQLSSVLLLVKLIVETEMIFPSDRERRDLLFETSKKFINENVSDPGANEMAKQSLNGLQMN